MPRLRWSIRSIHLTTCVLIPRTGRMYNRPLKRATRPDTLPSVTPRIRAGHSKFYVTITWMAPNKPFDVFIYPAEGEKGEKPDQCERAWAQALAKSISIGLQYGVPAEDFIDSLRGIQCVPGPDQDRGHFVKSPADGIAIILEEFINREAE